MDCFEPRIVGWAITDDLRAELVVGACEMAVVRRRRHAWLVPHSDQGLALTRRWCSPPLAQRRVRGLDGLQGACFDNPALASVS
jgi:putative transposase